MFRGFSAETIIICSNIIKEKIMVYLATLLTTFVYIIREFSVKKMRGIRGQKKQNLLRFWNQVFILFVSEN